ncbi:MAG: hypothetical protein LBD23_04400 [Oscillospiraceae bacterium]|jgi:uroporphyrinogen decarboxylase|nr:hypothetical protein [Oscillospiraceae bacterium]
MSINEMTSRERILAAIDHRPTDRVPLDYWGVGEITDKLMKHFNVNDMVGLAKAMDIDLIMGAGATLIKEDRHGDWDVEQKRIALPDGSGFYDEPVRYPIGDCETIDEIEACYEWPTTEMFDYSEIKKQAKELRDKGFAVSGGYISLTYFYSVIRGIEQMLLDFAGEPEIAEYILFKLNEFAHAHTKKILEAADGYIDISQVTDDFGSQRGLLMSEAMIERYFGKYYDENVAMVKEFGAHVFHHDDGAVMELVPWIIGKGCEILNPLQWHLPGWDLEKLKTEYGNKLCFHGGIDNQLVLPFQGKEEIKAEVRACIDILYSDNTGYILAPCHNVQAITPIENVITMYEYAREYGGNK